VNFSYIQKFKILGCDKTTPLTGISLRDSKEQKTKECKEWLVQNGIDERCNMHHGWGILSFLHSYLFPHSSSIILLSLGRGRASIVV
jgi:SET domain-containing protein